MMDAAEDCGPALTSVLTDAGPLAFGLDLIAVESSGQ